MKRYAGLILFCVLLVSKVGASALLVDWGNEKYVTTSTNLAGTPVVSDDVSRYAYSWDTPLSPSVGYTGPKFYGTLEARAGTGATATPGFSTVALTTSENTTRFRFDGENLKTETSGARGRLYGLIFFKQEDFLGDASASGSVVRFDADSSLSLNVQSFNSASRKMRMAVHALVDGEWGWYLSETNTEAQSLIFTIANAATEKWGLWSGVSADNILPDAPSDYDVLGSAFSNIDAVGFYFYSSGSSNGKSDPLIQLSGFQVSGLVVIPETAHVAAVLLIALLGVLVIRRKTGSFAR